MSVGRCKEYLEKNCIIISCMIGTSLQIKFRDELNKKYMVGFRLAFRKGKAKLIKVLREKL